MSGNQPSESWPVSIEIAKDSDVVLAGKRTRSMLEVMGCGELVVEETALVVKELATNIVDHAGEGQLTFETLWNSGTIGIEIRAEDTGPGIAAVDRAVVDGISSAEGIGGGLGTVHRLMDEVEVDSNTLSDEGVRITARRWLSDRNERLPPIDVGVATRPKPGESVNGDACLVAHLDGETLAGVVDGLGHGEPARRASREAERYVRTHAREPMDELFDGVETVCRSTRGVVLSLARIDWTERTVEIGAVGNVGMRFCHIEGSHRPISRRGVIGQGSKAPRIETVDWQTGSALVLFSDGVRSRWDCDGFGFQDETPAAPIASAMLEELARSDDDATVLVARSVR